MLGKNAKLFFLCSLCALVVAIVLATWGLPKIIDRQVHKNIQIENSSTMFEKWRVLPIPLSFKVYLFNVTNPEEVNAGGKPAVQETGPYVYKEYREKRILGYGANDTIKYMLKKTFHFDQEASGDLRETDELTVINYSYMAAVITIQSLMPAALPLVNRALAQFFVNLTDPFSRVQVKDLLFDGIFLNCAGDESALSLVCGKIKVDKPVAMRPSEDGKGFYFSMFSHLNRTESGPYEMVRGTEDVRDLGHIVSYDGMSDMRVWRDPYCGQINGSDGSIFPPIDESNVPQKLYTFEPEICRSMYVSLVGKRDIFNVSSYYYEIDESALASKSANPNNKCFCRRNWSANHDGCLLMGVLNIEPCKGAPAIVSLPHFYLASEELLEYVNGISPSREKHNSYVYIETKTGAVLKGVQRLQFNIELRQIEGVPQLEGVRTGLFPFLWIEEGAELSDDLISEVKLAQSMIGYAGALRWVILCCAVLLCAASGVCVYRSGAWPKHNSISFVMRNTFDVNKS
ncbi:sensory neuron membrane protein 2-like [Aricia agestis]|uniref:sensory neuron membrane protein 2-like n=1 Tax=Aricia agestis TaxID=91739 RepID=UPI001C204FAB|nr:sensory neuron membrane protein 2-like [Aricia agestis]XP_041972806.1 sensory neuron membrane protein 2-like [Aricia agestis]